VTRTLAVRLDSLGDVLVTGPALRALAASSDHLTLLCGPRGRAAAELLPGVDELLCWRSPWIDPEPDPVDPADVEELVARLAAGRYDRAFVFTSFHQSPLPTALLARLAGIGWVGAISEDYPGSLLDLRHRTTDDQPEPERALSLVRAAGYDLPESDDGRLALRPDAVVPSGVGSGHVVLHPGTSVPARGWPAELFRRTAGLLVEAGHRVVVTGAPDEAALTAYVAGGLPEPEVRDLGGLTDLAELAGVLGAAAAVVVGNTGPAHLAAAVGAPIVSLFAPTVPAVRWAPYAERLVLLGDQDAACRGSRATTCPVAGHPCLSSVPPEEVVAAVATLAGAPASAPPAVLLGTAPVGRPA
jgi:ADP-heptose:LPS heptosyltransferase